MKTKNFNKTTIHIFILATIIILSFKMSAQDKITFTNGDEMNVRVIEKTAGEIKFKKEDNIDGPTHVVSKQSVFSIFYSNGTTDLFSPQQRTTQPTAPIYQSTAPIYQMPPPVISDTNEFLTGAPKKFGGPRVGLTFITNGTMTDRLADKGKNPIVSLIGWQFEQRIFTIDNGACGLVEFIPLIGGMEQGMFLPSANLLIGLRGGGKRSPEVAMGPNLSVAGLGMVFAGGMNFRSGKINFPVNIAVVPSVGSKKNVTDAATGITSSKYFQTGWRFSVTVGFNSRKK